MEKFGPEEIEDGELGVVESCFFWCGLDWLVTYIVRVDLYLHIVHF